MKKLIQLILIVVLQDTALKAQDVDSLTLSKLKLNFVVPDMPAFKALGTEPSNLLRPSTPQAIAVSISEFYQGRQAIIPKAFAMEISPALLLNTKKQGNKQLAEYAHKPLNTLRISIGSSTDTFLSPSGRNLALGLRINVINKGDLTTDVAYQNEILKELRKFRNGITQKLRLEFAASKGKTFTDEEVDGLDIFISENIKEFNKFLKTVPAQETFAKRLQELKDQYKKDHWNDTKLDVALALLSSSPDSVVKNIRFNKAALWATYGLRTGDNSQLLIGVNATGYKNLLDKDAATSDKFYTDIAIPARYLIGTNRVKGFLEAQYKYASATKSNKCLVNMGSEMNLTDGLWINIYGGMNYDSITGSDFITNLSIKFTIPEKFEFY